MRQKMDFTKPCSRIFHHQSPFTPRILEVRREERESAAGVWVEEKKLEQNESGRRTPKAAQMSAEKDTGVLLLVDATLERGN